MRHSLHPIDSPESYKRLLDKQLAGLKLSSRIVRIIGLLFFVIGTLVSGKDPFFSLFGAFVFALCVIVTMVMIQNKASEFSYFEALTRGAQIEFDRLAGDHLDDPEVARFVKDIKSKGRSPVVSESIRLKKYIKQKRKSIIRDQAILKAA